MFRSVLIAAFAIAILTAAAIAHGYRTDRWGAPANLEEAARRLNTLPMTIGDWESEELGMDPRQAQMTQATGILVRKYTHRHDRTPATVMILCGRPGPIAVHPPEACYGGAGFTPSPARVHRLPDGGDLWVGDFVKGDPNPETLRIFWGWSDGKNWSAAESPRFQYFQSKVLYKLYVIHPVVRTRDDDPGPDTRLLDALITELRNCLVTTP